jgi:hypothetical protein
MAAKRLPAGHNLQKKVSRVTHVKKIITNNMANLE